VLRQQSRRAVGGRAASATRLSPQPSLVQAIETGASLSTSALTLSSDPILRHQGKKSSKAANPKAEKAEGAGVPGSGVPSGILKGQVGYEDVVMECEGFERYYQVRADRRQPSAGRRA
jgi:hypothetical protein